MILNFSHHKLNKALATLRLRRIYIYSISQKEELVMYMYLVL
jgi:hypothetical protein